MDFSQLMARLEAEAGAVSGRRLPPVEGWNPPDCGDIGMEIRRDGSWWHAGSRFTREPLMRLFSTLLRKDADCKTWLLTPHEKVIVHVADAHFIAIRADQVDTEAGPGWVLTTNVGDVVELDADHPLRVVATQGDGVAAYVRVRGRLEARLARPVFYELCEHAEPLPEGGLGLRSHGQVFSLEV
jgi:hypothetical protein